MNIGFTGTQKGATLAQLATITEELMRIKSGEFHHGDCIGADTQAHKIAYYLDFAIVIHPPLNPSKRAFCPFGRAFVLKAKPYLDRNRDIVDATELLIATPAEFEMQQRSGTWSTIRYAVRTGKKLVIIFPDGSVKREL